MGKLNFVSKIAGVVAIATTMLIVARDYTMPAYEYAAFPVVPPPPPPIIAVWEW
jgi:hypothetical protein